MIVAVTGGFGFIGTELVKQLVQQDNIKYVWIIDKAKKPSHEIFSNPKVLICECDLTNIKFNEFKLKKIFEETDMVYGLAAVLGGIKFFHLYPADIISENNTIISNTLNLICKSSKKPKFIYISSSMVYECATEFPTKEEDVEKIPKPLSSYGFSKLCGEEYCKAYNEQFGLEYVICRPFNAFSCLEYPKEVGMSHVIPDIIKKIYQGQGTEFNPLEIFGDGQQVRCITHTEDIGRGVILAANNEFAVNQAFNISTSKPYKVIEIVNLIWNRMKGRQELFIKNVESFKYDVKQRIPDVNKARNILGFESKYILEDRIDEVIKWVCENVD